MSELSEKRAFLVLNALPHIGPVSVNRLIARFGGAPQVFDAGKHDLEQVRGIGPAASAAILGWRELFDIAREEERMEKAGVVFVTRSDPEYPRLLREIDSAPVGFYRKGANVLDAPCVAIVGSRRTTLYGLATAKKLAAGLARLGFCVVSGLARGIDAAAHEGALSAGGKTAAVLGTGIDIVYPPENVDLFRQVAAAGALLSEFPLGRRADIQSFAMRNRIVSGLCEAVVVVESGVSGGSMITARFAGEQGRLLFAVPGRIDQETSAGCHQLIRDGATLLTGVDDILSELNYLGGLRPRPIPDASGGDGGGAPAPRPPDNLPPEEAAVLACLANGAALTADAVSVATGLGVEKVSGLLLMLELRRLVVKRADGSFEARV
ncbi:MAG: DNA-processing protein DprA [Opitutaceae bacterium]|jgi:DNA processing protein|nr:DNA-processing protein DprA [Opitutaceae bacterium]